jgi:hypothetical protein
MRLSDVPDGTCVGALGRIVHIGAMTYFLIGFAAPWHIGWLLWNCVDK